MGMSASFTKNDAVHKLYATLFSKIFSYYIFTHTRVHIQHHTHHPHPTPSPAYNLFSLGNSASPLVPLISELAHTNHLLSFFTRFLMHDNCYMPVDLGILICLTINPKNIL